MRYAWEVTGRFDAEDLSRIARVQRRRDSQGREIRRRNARARERYLVEQDDNICRCDVCGEWRMRDRPCKVCDRCPTCGRPATQR